MYITTLGMWLIAIFVIIVVYKLYSIERKVNEHTTVINNHYWHIKTIENDLYEECINEENLKEYVDNQK